MTDAISSDYDHPSGFIYILTNESISDYVKIGHTCHSPYVRAAQLFSTGVPTPFKIAYAFFVTDRVAVEKKLHHHLSKFRVDGGNREFFRISAEKAAEIFQEICGEALDPVVYNLSLQISLREKLSTERQTNEELKRRIASLESEIIELENLRDSERKTAHIIANMKAREAAYVNLLLNRAHRAEGKLSTEERAKLEAVAKAEFAEFQQRWT